MSEIQNVGAVDSLQYQPSQYPDENYTENYETQPEIYDEKMAEMQAANQSRLGATLLSGIIIAGLAGVGGYLIGKRGKIDVEAMKQELEQLKNSDAVKNYENLKNGLEDLEKMANENDKAIFGWCRKGSEFKQKFDEIIKPLKKTAEEAKEKTEESIDTAA